MSVYRKNQLTESERKKRKLSHAGIRTISDLLSAYENTPSSVSSVRRNIEDFKDVQAKRGELELIKNVPQLVAGLNYRPEDPIRTGGKAALAS